MADLPVGGGNFAGFVEYTPSGAVGTYVLSATTPTVIDYSFNPAGEPNTGGRSPWVVGAGWSLQTASGYADFADVCVVANEQNGGWHLRLVVGPDPGARTIYLTVNAIYALFM